LACINKADIYPAGAAQIEAYCEANGVVVAGRIPFDPTVTEAMVHGEPVTAYRPHAQAGRALNAIWQRVAARLAGGLG
ncbi:MAG: (4Fe-4S)-binding protein, partial [Chloroflexi bacterium HGW-Chloroflexi-1]